MHLLDPRNIPQRSDCQVTSWDDAYIRELANHTTSAEDEGTVWFSDAGAEERVSSWLENAHDDDDGMDYRLKHIDDAQSHATSFLDLGTGNGHMLFELRRDGWQGFMVGVDYSAKSVELCQQILRGRSSEESLGDIRFERHDLLEPMGSRPAWLPEQGFDVVLDKGTFDAISLSSETDAAGRRINETYAQKVEPLIKHGGLLIITSCNWTEDEIKHWFERPQGMLKFADSIKYPSFTFGGKSGSQVCTLIFQKTLNAQ